MRPSMTFLMERTAGSAVITEETDPFQPDSSGLFWNIPMAHFKMYVKSMVA
jgi:hypothetical protein